MLIPHAMGGSAAEYYTQGLGADDYYLQGYDPPGTWYGRGATDLGIADQQVTRDAFCNVFDGYTPHGKEKLVQNAGEPNRQAGWDCVVTLPKDQSIAYARATPEERKNIEEVALNRIKEVLDYYQDTFLTSRRGKNGGESVKANLVCAIFPHITSRALDPHLHWHVTVMNACTRDLGNGRWDTGTIESKSLYHRQKLLSAMVDTSITQGFFEMGLLTVGQGRDTMLAVVPEALTKEMSKRHQAIEVEKERLGDRDPDADMKAWRNTRQKKARVPRDELFASWALDFDRHGLTEQVFRAAHQASPPVNQQEQITRATSRATETLTRNDAYFSDARFMKEVFVEARGKGLSFDFIRDSVSRHLGREQAVRLGVVRGDELYTTPEMLELEANVFAQAEASKGKNQHRVSERSVHKAISQAEAEASKKKGAAVTFNEEQVAAINRITRGDDAIVCITGDAGTGKTTVCKAACLAFEREGFRCIGAALAKKAAHVLEGDAGIKSTSITKLIGSEELGAKGDLDKGFLDEVKHHARQLKQAAIRSLHENVKNTPIIGRLLPRGKNTYAYDPVTIDHKTVLFVDEAGMVATRQMQKLISTVLERGGKICLLGDAKQLQPIDAGSPFRALTDILGEARLSTIVRQRHEVDREAVRAISRGDASEAFKSWKERGLLHIAATQKAATDQMVSAWAKEGVKNAKENLLVCSTNKDRFELNSLAQAEMKRAKKLGRKAFTLGGEDFHKGDRIAFTRNSPFGVSNGDTGTITRIGRKQITRKTFHGKQFRSLYAMAKYAEKVRADKTLWMTVKLDSGKVVDIELDRYQDFRLGYAQNTVQAQGQTVDNVYVLTGGPTLDREMLYVQASRSRNAPRVFAGSIPQEPGQKPRDTTADLVWRASRSRAKENAHDVMERNQEQGRVIQR